MYSPNCPTIEVSLPLSAHASIIVASPSPINFRASKPIIQKNIYFASRFFALWADVCLLFAAKKSYLAFHRRNLCLFPYVV